jgi:23S rRNA pseudouridine2605 synthase
MRLARYLAHAGVASRRASESLIASGKVTVDGELAVDPARDVDLASDVRVDGRPVKPEPREAWIVNKPLGVVSTASDERGRPVVVDLVSSERRLYPVGRLDADSQGLILLTNDGDLANRLMHPRYQLERAYRVRLARPLGDRQLRALRRGIELEDGPTAPAEARRLGQRELEIAIREGRNRQVRRMVEAVGNRVVGLTRIRFGPLKLGRLAPGGARLLRPAEVEALWKDSGDG